MRANTIRLLALDIDGVLTDGRVSLGQGGLESKGLAFRDLDALGRARAAGLGIALVTGVEGPLVDVVAARVQPDRVFRGAKDKHAALHALAKASQLSVEQMCYVGDADRDAPALRCAGLGLAPADASLCARQSADRVLASAGGSGAVAEAVELVLRNLSETEQAAARVAEMQRIAQESVAAHQKFAELCAPALARIAEVLIVALRAGRKVLLCGNGGSAADAQHVAAELMGRFLIDREPWPAIALTTDSSILTAVGNDWAFQDVFARQVRALARPGDVVVGISTSGTSPNVIRAFEAARSRGAICVGFTGLRGAELESSVDECFVAPVGGTPRVQELHILAWHSICEIVERALAEAA